MCVRVGARKRKRTRTGEGRREPMYQQNLEKILIEMHFLHLLQFYCSNIIDLMVLYHMIKYLIKMYQALTVSKNREFIDEVD